MRITTGGYQRQAQIHAIAVQIYRSTSAGLPVRVSHQFWIGNYISTIFWLCVLVALHSTSSDWLIHHWSDWCMLYMFRIEKSLDQWSVNVLVEQHDCPVCVQECALYLASRHSRFAFNANNFVVDGAKMAFTNISLSNSALILISCLICFFICSSKLYIIRTFGWIMHPNIDGFKWSTRWACLYHGHRAT